MAIKRTWVAYSGNNEVDTFTDDGKPNNATADRLRDWTRRKLTIKYEDEETDGSKNTS